jgi:hypothetical protein
LKSDLPTEIAQAPDGANQVAREEINRIIAFRKSLAAIYRLFLLGITL